jgi:hypothetical protein
MARVLRLLEWEGVSNLAVTSKATARVYPVINHMDPLLL